MSYFLLADSVLVLHLLFIVFVVLGGLLAMRWRWIALLHIPAALWGVYVELTGRGCPLTGLENSLRQQAGEAGYSGGFVEHYLMPLIYPAGLTRDLQYILAGIVIGVNLAVYGWLLYSRRRA